MSSSSSSSSADNNKPIVVAIDKNKPSTLAVRWAIDHLLFPDQALILIHVRTRRVDGSNGGGGVDVNCGQLEDIFSPFRAYCARKGILHTMVQEVVIEGTEVHTALLEYIKNNHVTNFVLGASSKHHITRKFWIGHDVPSMINKAAPDFCSVYVIVRGKAQSIRPSASSGHNNKLQSLLALVKLNSSELENGNRNPFDHHEALDRWFQSSKGDNNNHMVQNREPARHSTNGRDFSDDDLTKSRFVSVSSMDVMRVRMSDTTNMGEKTFNVEGSELSKSEAHYRLKRELKKTIQMYTTACKQAISAQHEVDELQQLKMDEMNKIEQARLAEEEALTLVELERKKCIAATEAAEKAQKIAEKEMQRRKYAEMKVKREADEKKRALDVLSNKYLRYRRYTIEEIQAATKNFSSSKKVGEGGYGPVFKARLDHTPVAIKLLRPDAAQGRKQFQQEVEVLSCMRHPNMVILLGACPEYGCLVYEFMDNGSLEDRLFRKGNTPPIPWGIRFKLAADIATGLLFLHQAKPEPLVHRDLKPANILLDHHYTCKISDVGLARLVPPSVADLVTQYHMTSAAGTFCYIDPEYQQTGKLGTKSDIYSLGIMLLQIITARPPMGLTHHVERAIERGEFEDLLDPAVPDWPVEDALGFARLGLKCAELRKKDRPDLGKEIVPELNRLMELGMKHGLGHW